MSKVDLVLASLKELQEDKEFKKKTNNAIKYTIELLVKRLELINDKGK